MEYNAKYIVAIAIILLVVLYIYMSMSRREHFTQGYDYLISGCIKKCELELLRQNPYFTQLQEGGRMTQNYCRMVCATEYNKNNPKVEGVSPCQLRKPPYHQCPHSKCRYGKCHY